MTSPDPLDEIGLPAGQDRHVTLFYNSPAKTLIAVCTDGQAVGKRVFVRQISETRYREVVLPFDLGFIDDAAVCSGMPLLFLNVFRWRTSTRAAADFAALARVSLPIGAPKPLPQPRLVDTPAWNGPAIPTDLWIEKILGVAADGLELSVVAAIDVPTGETLHSSHVERWVATFDVSGGGVKPISRLLADWA